MKLKVCLSDGKTLGFVVPMELDKWHALQADSSFHHRVRSLALTHNAKQNVLSAPVGLGRAMYTADVRLDKSGVPAAAVVGYVAAGINVRLIVYYGQSPELSKTEVRRVGQPRYINPRGEH